MDDIIYKIKRGPTRSVFYIDVGNMPREEVVIKLSELIENIKKERNES